MISFPSLDRRSVVVSILALLVIAVSVGWTWHTQFARPPFNTTLQQGIGEALAQRTRATLAQGGKILVVTLESGDSPALQAQFEAFKAALSRPGPRDGASRSQLLEIVEIERLDADKKSKYGPGSGLSASRLLRLAAKNQDVDAIVSFVGLPDLEPKELTALGTNGPRLIAFSRNLKKLGPLLASRRLEAAVVPRFQFPSPIAGEPRTPAEWFDLQCQWITPSDLGQVP